MHIAVMLAHMLNTALLSILSDILVINQSDLQVVLSRLTRVGVTAMKNHSLMHHSLGTGEFESVEDRCDGMSKANNR